MITTWPLDSVAAVSHDWNWIWFGVVNGADAAKIFIPGLVRSEVKLSASLSK